MIAAVAAAIRGYCELVEEKPSKRASRKREPLSQTAIVFDCETTTDETQRLTFGAWSMLEKIAGEERYAPEPIERGLFYADGPGTPPEKSDELRAFAAGIAGDRGIELRVLSQTEFLEHFFQVTYRSRALVVGFNLPFDLARIARDASEARKSEGAHSLLLWPKTRGGRVVRTATGKLADRPYRPRVVVKSLGPKKAAFRFTLVQSAESADEAVGWAKKLASKITRGAIPAPWASGSSDLTPTQAAAKRLVEASRAERPALEFELREEYLARKGRYRGRFLDLFTLAHALTDRTYSLARAAKAWGVAEKGEPGEHPGFAYDRAYVEYCLRDVATTSELLGALLDDFNRHPIELAPDRAFSSASIGKAYLRALGVAQPLERWPDFAREALGIAQAAYYGGRTSVRVRRAVVPVQYVDVLSAYPTVNALLGNMRILRAADVVWEDCTDEARATIDALDPESLFDPAAWPALNFFGEVELDGSGCFPVRAQYDRDDAARRIGMVHVESDEPAWYHGCDLAASIVMTTNRPTLLRAFRVAPKRAADGSVPLAPGLRPVAFGGYATIDPATEDVFTRVIELRQKAKRDASLPPAERERLDKGLKVLANATGYGIYGEVNAREGDDDASTIRVHSGGAPFDALTDAPELPGPYYFAPIATSITAGAHLVLALIEREVRMRGGSYALEDTDSSAIVATKCGGRVPMPNGPLPWSDADAAAYDGALPNANGAIYALSFAQVDEICARFASLSPYDRSAVPSSVLKIEDVNVRPDGSRRQLYAYAVSSKRYALFELDAQGRPNLLLETPDKPKAQLTESGLGAIAWPAEAGSSDTQVRAFWQYIVERNLGLAPEVPPWFAEPVAAKLPLASIESLRAFAPIDAGKPYELRAKPYGFCLTVRLQPGSRSYDTRPTEGMWQRRVRDVADRLLEQARESREPFLQAFAKLGASDARSRENPGRVAVALFDGKPRGEHVDILARYRYVDRSRPEGTVDLFIQLLGTFAPGATEDEALAFLRGERYAHVSRAEAMRTAAKMLKGSKPEPGAIVVSERPRLVAPRCASEEWLAQGAASPWFDLRTGGRCELDVESRWPDLRDRRMGRTDDDTAAVIAALTFGELAHVYEQHPETKSATASGAVCGLEEEDYRGPLERRSVRIASYDVVGKESTNFANSMATALGELVIDDEDDGGNVIRSSVDPAIGELLAGHTLESVAREAKVPRAIVQAVRDGKVVAGAGLARVVRAARRLEAKPSDGDARDGRRQRHAARAARNAATISEAQRAIDEAAWWGALDDVGGTIVPDAVLVGKRWQVAPEFRALPWRHRVVGSIETSSSRTSGNLEQLVAALAHRGVADATRSSAIAFFATTSRPNTKRAEAADTIV